jgi:DNA topoisomerase-2
MEWKKLTHVEHILKRPDSYVGSLVPGPVDTWRLVDDHFERHTVHIAPALIKIFDEILVNAIDQHTLHPRKVTRIDVSWKPDGTVTVRNNGDGIPIKKHQTENVWIPELIFGHLLTSSNYDDDKERTTGGRNGYGAKLTNVFSKRFTVRIGTKYSQTWHDNMSRMDEPIIREKGDTTGVEIEFLPDWSKFGQGGPTQDFFTVVTRRTWDAAMWTKAHVTLNGQRLEVESLEAYARMHTQGPIVTLGKDIVVAHTDTGKFEQVSYVNGIATTQGGTHIDRFVSLLVAALPVKDVRPAQVRACLWVFMRATRDRPTFSSQTKTECTSKDTTEYVFRPATIKAVMACGLADDLAALEMAKSEKVLNKTNGSKRSKVNVPKLDDANWAGTARSVECTLIVTEGDSAKTLAVAGLSVVGRDRYGVFPLRGKPRNVRDASVKQLTENEEFSNLKKILGLQHGKKYTSLRELRYGRLMIMTDADKDGSHIKGLVLNMIHHFWPELIELGFLVAMVTPVIKVGKKWFFTEAAYKASGARGQVKYYKGLGTSTSAEAKEYFKSIEQLTVKFEPDEHMDESVALAFAKSMADERKTWLVNHMKTPPNGVEYGSVQRLGVSDFVHRDLVFFSAEDIHRSIPHLMDGLKPSQRKVLYACMKRGLTSDMKVAQLAGYVAEVTAYHHGEASLQGTIIGLAQNFVGSNNVNLLEPSGQFGTRLMGGKDAASPRYIFTRLASMTRKIFDPADDAVLKYVVDDGQTVEPEWYAPIVPMVLVNGAEGIGTGFSCYVPPYKLEDLVTNIQCALDGRPMVPMAPYFTGFTGSVERKNEHTWILSGTATEENGYWHVTELPPGLWIQDFKEHLDELSEKGTISRYENHSTETKPDFKIWGGALADLGLKKSVHTSNMYLVGPKGIRKYASPEEILTEFLEVRIKVYARRRTHLLEKMTCELSVLNHRMRFIQLVISGSLRVFRRPLRDIQVELKQFEFPESLWGMLLDTKTSQYTAEEIERLGEKVNRLERDIDVLRRTSVPELWKQNLSQL